MYGSYLYLPVFACIYMTKGTEIPGDISKTILPFRVVLFRNISAFSCFHAE